MLINKKNDWLFAGMLTIPIVLFALSYLFYHPPALIPTGFIQYDNPGYIAYARQYLDAGHFSLFYSNPFNDSGEYAGIYFQTQTIFFALCLKAGIPPGAILIPFTIICSFFCFRLIIAIFDHLAIHPRHRKLSIILFAWGGGLFILSSMLFRIVNLQQDQGFWGSIFFTDPGSGWWGLSLGRSLFFSCEGYYHLLFLLCILFILKQRWKLLFLPAFLLSVSHPFTGIELVSILFLWLLVEKLIIRNKNIPLFVFIGILFLLVFQAWYYLYYLNQFSDHRSVSTQYSLNWYVSLIKMIPAYGLVGALAVYTLFLSGKSFFRKTENRLFICWFIVALLLSKHELFMKPMQPIHFTRGYIWTSLFLIGIPALQLFLSRIRTTIVSRFILAVFIFIFLLDNTGWILKYSITYDKSGAVAYLSREQKDILHTIKQNSSAQTLIVGYSSEEEGLPYLSTVYTKSYSWISHPFTTPFFLIKKKAYEQFINQGTIDPAWTGRNIIFIFRKTNTPEMTRAGSISFAHQLLIETPGYFVVTARIPRIQSAL